MSTPAQCSQDFIELAKQTFAENGFVPSPALIQSTGKTLARLVVDVVSSPVAQTLSLSHEDMLRRCALA
jgi:hypothetical protein